MTSVLESPAAQRLAWTLLHFLWQGAVLGLLAWGSFALLRRQRPQLRYLVGCLFLVACLGSAATMFLLLTPSASPLGQIIDVDQAARFQGLQAAPAAVYDAPLAVAPPWQARLQPCLPWILATWGLGVLGLSLRAAGGWLWLHRLKAAATPIAEPVWLGRLVQTAGLRRVVRFLEAARVRTPMCMGLLRPVILLPLGFFTNLDPIAAEAVLAHELAHIRRLDGLVNGLQCVIEVLFFFHPAVWWISRRIRAEREHCCDDAAVLTCGDAVLYAEALSRLDAFHDRALALELGARGGNLMERMRRLLRSDPPQLPFTMPSLGFIVALVLVGAIPAQAEKPKTPLTLTGESTSALMAAAESHLTLDSPAAHPSTGVSPIPRTVAVPIAGPTGPEFPAAPGQVVTPPAAPAPQAQATRTPQPSAPVQGVEPQTAQAGIIYTKTQGGLPVLKGTLLPTTRGLGMGATLLPPTTAIIEDEVPEHRVNWYSVLVAPKTTVRIQARSADGGAYLRLTPVGWALSARQPFRGAPECTFSNTGSSETSLGFYLTLDVSYIGPRRIAIHQSFTPLDRESGATIVAASSPEPPASNGGAEPTLEEARQHIQAFAQLRPWGDGYAQTISTVKLLRKERWNSAYTDQWPKGPEAKAMLKSIKPIEGWAISFQVLTQQNAPRTFLVLMDQDGVIHWRTPWKRLPPGLNNLGAPTP